jgi:hypothetical protein
METISMSVGERRRLAVFGRELKTRVSELYRERYRDYGPTLAAECCCRWLDRITIGSKAVG